MTVGRDGLEAAGCDYSSAGREGRRAREAVRSYDPEVLVVRSTKVTEQMMDAGRVKLIVRAGAGYNTIDVGAASRRGVYVSNCPAKTPSPSGTRLRAHPRARRRVADNVYNSAKAAGNRRSSRRRAADGPHARARRHGEIGQEMIARARAFGIRWCAWSRSLTPERAAELGVGTGQSRRRGASSTS